MAEQPTEQKFLRLRLEQCEDGGWFVAIHELKGEAFVGRKVFPTTADLCDFLTRKFPGNPNGH